MVISQAGRKVGLAVDRIVDIVDEQVAAKTLSTQPGILYSAVIQQRVTDLLDVKSVMGQCQPSPTKEPLQEPVEV